MGTVTSGLVGRQAIVYDLWGDAVNLAFRLQGGTTQPGVFVTQSVADRVADLVPFTDVGSGRDRVGHAAGLAHRARPSRPTTR